MLSHSKVHSRVVFHTHSGQQQLRTQILRTQMYSSSLSPHLHNTGAQEAACVSCSDQEAGLSFLCGKTYCPRFKNGREKQQIISFTVQIHMTVFYYLYIHFKFQTQLYNRNIMLFFVPLDPSKCVSVDRV